MNKILNYCFDSSWILPTVGISLIGLLIGILFWITTTSEKQWQEFKVEHHCEITQKMSGSTSVGSGVGAGGKPVVVVVTTSGKTGWLCDDGITYWR